jgi:SAM-dependent methyltransferase
VTDAADGMNPEGNRAFEGWRGTAAAQAMAVLNADMERAAVTALRPAPGEDFLVVGFGAGVGLVALLDAVEPGSVTAVDPSPVMVRAARRRLARHRPAVAMRLVEGTALDLCFEPEVFDAVVAVNSQQLWRPHRHSLANIARSLRPGGRLVTLTHQWAIARGRAIGMWQAAVKEDLAATGFGEPEWTEATYRTGRAIGLEATRGKASDPTRDW